MGLPRYLKDKFKSGDYALNKVLFHGIGETFEEFFKRKSVNITYHAVVNSAVKYGLKLEYRIKPKKIYDTFTLIGCPLRKPFEDNSNPFEKEVVAWYCGLYNNNGKWFPKYKYLEVNRWFAQRATDISSLRLAEEIKIQQQKDEIERIKNMQQGRYYKGKLKHIIMQRDNFKCVFCGKTAKNGVVLEVDHIIEWEDGGRTTYDNGQTLCSDCNKGKYHAKDFNRKIIELQKAVNG